MKIYVAAPFADWRKARAFGDLLRERGHEIVGDWTGDAERSAGADTAPQEVRVKGAFDCLGAVKQSEVFVLLTPDADEKHKGCGAWTELGLAIDGVRRVMVVGEQRNRNVFALLPGVERYETGVGVLLALHRLESKVFDSKTTTRPSDAIEDRLDRIEQRALQGGSAILVTPTGRSFDKTVAEKRRADAGLEARIAANPPIGANGVAVPYPPPPAIPRQGQVPGTTPRFAPFDKTDAYDAKPPVDADGVRWGLEPDPPERRVGLDDRRIVDQPPPVPNTSRPVWELTIEDMKARDAVGRERYGTPLQIHNGRDALVDAYQEALDLAVYLRQAIEERGGISTLHTALKLDDNAIRCCRTIGRDEEARHTTIGLTELDALCDQAGAALRLAERAATSALSPFRVGLVEDNMRLSKQVTELQARMSEMVLQRQGMPK